MMEITQRSSGNNLGLRISGTLTGDDYAKVVPTIEKLIAEHRKIGILAEFDDMSKVEPQAVWDDLKLSRHIGDFERMAIVSDRDWIRRFTGMVSAVAPMPVRYFPLSEVDAAWGWLQDEATA